MKYKTLNIYIHDSKQHNQFIVQQIQPLQEELSRNKKLKNFVLRHWRKGPHIQWHIQIDKEFTMDHLLWIKGKLQENIGQYSSVNQLTQAELKKQYLMLKDFEMEVEDLFPIEQDATIKLEDSSLRTDIWGETGVESIKEYYVKSNKLIMEMLNEPVSAKYKNTICMMIAAIHAIGKPNETQLSFRSHAEAFLNRFDKEDEIRSHFEKIYNKNKGNIEVLVNELIEKEKYFNEWLNIYKDTIKDNEPLIESRQLLLPEAETYMKIVQENQWNPGYEGRISEFHGHLNSLPKYGKIKQTMNFQIKRLILNFLYLTIAQIGIKPVDKFSMCYSISRFYEEKLNKNWKQQLDDNHQTASIK
ncbi:lantibiotic dehydratase C-terminal domain-containing protein [Virgibacillus sediminis]|uniref:Lantibiotic dehydratase C-terminal domain-containing protein n=1 Tax=Virgibacillus sediminis TaxID=202260 RepID=A0ABV7ABB0_9BACI